MSETAVDREEEKKPSKWMALLVLLVALLLLFGGVGGTLMWSNSREQEGDGPVALLGNPMLGRQVVLKYGCVQCHSDDGTRQIGPSFKGLFNSTVLYIDGSEGKIDEADVRLALVEPNAKVIEGFDPQMKPYPNMGSEEIVNLLAYLRSIGAQ